ncbi:MAG: hypothetical protein ACT4R6_02410 [Gemmatimonadaceae bacterium]
MRRIESNMYWISDEQRVRALALVSDRPLSAREQFARTRLLAERRRRALFAALAFLVVGAVLVFR